jgi:hypothetical protein
MPPRIKKKYKVIKVPLEQPFEYKVAHFPQMPILYLELLENKAKVVPQLRGVDYKPELSQLSQKEVWNAAENELIKEVGDPEFTVFKRRSPAKQQRGDIVDVTSGSEVLIKKSPSESAKRRIQFEEDSGETISLKDEPPRQTSGQTTGRAQLASILAVGAGSTDFEQERSRKEPEPERSADPIAQMLRGEHSEKQQESFQNSFQGHPQSQPQNDNRSNMPPTLSQISNRMTQQGGLRDLNTNMKQDELDLSKKRDLLFKFKLLKRGYKEANIPEYNEYTDLSVLEKEYETLVRQLKIDSKVENYKKYLALGFTVMEFLLLNMLNFDEAKGYTQEQMVNMNEYEKILIEIGERSSLDSASQWSPEMRLAGMVMMNTVVFMGTKMLFKATGNNLMNALKGSGLGGGQQQRGNEGGRQESKPFQQQKKSKMKGPDIDFDDIDVNKKNA